MEKFKALRDKVSNSEQLQSQIRNGVSFMTIAKEAGIDISQQELEAGLGELNHADADLSDFELEMIAGGSGIPSGGNPCGPSGDGKG